MLHELNVLLALLAQISIEASVLAALILIVQGLLRKHISASLRCAMWGLLMIRLALPALPRAPFSVFNLLGHSAPPRAAPEVGSVRIITGHGDALPDVPSAAPNTPAIRHSYPPVPTSRLDWKSTIGLIWLAGFFLLIVKFAINMIHLCHLCKARELSIPSGLLDHLEQCRRRVGISRLPRLVISRSIRSPALCGMVRPMLLLPADLLNPLTEQELDFVLLHELMHLKRKDVAWGMMFWFFNALHWFNPALWLAGSRFRADREIACDAAVLALTAPSDHPAYGRTILKLLAKLIEPGPLPVAIGAAMVREGSTLKRRVAAIAHPIPKSRMGTATAAFAMVVLALLMLTHGQQIPTTHSAPQGTVQRVYDVRDVVVAVDSNAEPAYKLDEWGFPVMTGGPTSNPSKEQSDAMRQRQLGQIVRRLEQSVAMESWKDNGGQIGLIESLPAQGQLIITQTPDNQDLIAGLLEMWRGEGSAQITVETLVLGHLGDVAHQPPIPGKWVGEDGGRWSEFLDDNQVNKLLALMQQNKNSTIMAAPRVTQFNNQGAYVVVSTQTAYVASVTPIRLVDGSISYDPHVKNIQSGVFVDFKPSLSSDHQTVKLEAHMRANSLKNLESVTVPGSNPPVSYQIPFVNSAKSDTTIDIPTGKSALFRLSPDPKPALADPAAEDATLVLIKPTVISQGKP